MSSKPAKDRSPEIAPEISACGAQPDAAHAPIDATQCTLSRRRFVEGMGALAGLAAAGTVPAFLTALPATALEGESAEGSATVPGSEHETGLEHIVEHSGEVNYPGKPVWYADEPGDQKWAIDRKSVV